MNKETQIALVKEMNTKELEILETKGNDYAGEDILKNFQEVSNICEILNVDSRTLYGTHLFYIILKLQRICNLLTPGKEAKNESIEDSIIDLRNYLSLLNCSIRDSKDSNKVDLPGVNFEQFRLNLSNGFPQYVTNERDIIDETVRVS